MEEDPNKLLKEDNTPQDKEEPIQDKEEEGIELEEDVYSLMFLEGFGPVLLYSLVIVGMQLLIVGLFFADVLRDREDGNRLSIPINVDTQVTIAQFVALPLAVMSHEDCITALYHLSVKYDPKILETYPSATRSYWIATLVLRFTVGFLLIFISFIQIMQSERITDLFLNLEAIVLVGNIDNFAFWLAQKGFLRKDFQEAAKRVGEVSLTRAGKEMWCKKQISRTWVRRVLMLLTWVILILGWITISIKQWKGGFLFAAACQSFTVQFGDDTLQLQRDLIDAQDTIRSYASFNITEETSELDLLYSYNKTDISEVDLLYSYFSGTYKLGDYYNQRGVYYESIDSNLTSYLDKGQFYYCDGEDGNEGLWIFTINAVRNAFVRENDDDDCVKGWLMRSPPTNAFTLEEVPTEGWRVWTGSSKAGTVSAASNFNIVCNDCEMEVDCNYHGKCIEETKVCECSLGYLGSSCEIDPPCLGLEMDMPGREGIPVVETFELKLVKKDRTFASLEVVTPSQELLLVYGRPVYAISAETRTPESLREVDAGGSGYWYMLVYSGNRWYFTLWDFDSLDFIFFVEGIPVHAFWDELYAGKTEFFSEVTTSGTPVGITWNTIGQSGSKGDYGHFGAETSSLSVSFHCPIQNESCDGLTPTYCGFYGKCVKGKCECSDDGFTGRFCQYGSLLPMSVGPSFFSTIPPTGGTTVFSTFPPTGATVSPTSPLTGGSTNDVTNGVTFPLQLTEGPSFSPTNDGFN